MGTEGWGGGHPGVGDCVTKEPESKSSRVELSQGSRVEQHHPTGAQPSWEAQPSCLPTANVSPACPEPSQGGRTPCPPHSLALTVVGEARFAQTHDKVHFHLVRSHRFGANGALETWKESREASP